MKKYLSGFVPVNYKQAGTFLLAIGVVFFIAKLTSLFTKLFFVSVNLVYFGIGFFVIGLYLIFVVSKNKSK